MFRNCSTRSGSWYCWFSFGLWQLLKEEMQVGLNAYALYKGFNDVQSVVIEKSAVT
jgi:hypothetical protein